MDLDCRKNLCALVVACCAAQWRRWWCVWTRHFHFGCQSTKVLPTRNTEHLSLVGGKQMPWHASKYINSTWTFLFFTAFSSSFSIIYVLLIPLPLPTGQQRRGLLWRAAVSFAHFEWLVCLLFHFSFLYSPFLTLSGCSLHLAASPFSTFLFWQMRSTKQWVEGIEESDFSFRVWKRAWYLGR